MIRALIKLSASNVRMGGFEGDSKIIFSISLIGKPFRGLFCSRPGTRTFNDHLRLKL